jgi:type I restriction enzyme M protein
MAEASEQINNHAGFIWSVGDLLRGDYKQSEYGTVILPLTVLRRLDCVLDPVKPAMLEKYEQVKGKVGDFGPLLEKANLLCSFRCSGRHGHFVGERY